MKWFSRSKQASQLARLLDSYKPYVAPHVLGNHLLSEAQAADNLQYLLDNKNDRLKQLSALLAEFDITLTTNAAESEVEPLIEQLYRWAREHWPATISPKLATTKAWRTTDRQNDQIIYSVIMDTAIALGDMTIQQRPTFAWALDLDPVNIKDQMASAKRPVLQAKSISHPDTMALVDWEEVAVTQLIDHDMVAYKALNQWQQVYENAVSGLVEGSWVEN